MIKIIFYIHINNKTLCHVKKIFYIKIKLNKIGFAGNEKRQFFSTAGLCRI